MSWGKSARLLSATLSHSPINVQIRAVFISKLAIHIPPFYGHPEIKLLQRRPSVERNLSVDQPVQTDKTPVNKAETSTWLFTVTLPLHSYFHPSHELSSPFFTVIFTHHMSWVPTSLQLFSPLPWVEFPLLHSYFHPSHELSSHFFTVIFTHPMSWVPTSLQLMKGNSTLFSTPFSIA